MNPDRYRGFTRLTRISAILGISFAGDWQLTFALATAYVAMLASGIIHDEAPGALDWLFDWAIRRLEK